MVLIEGRSRSSAQWGGWPPTRAVGAAECHPFATVCPTRTSVMSRRGRLRAAPPASTTGPFGGDTGWSASSPPGC